MALYRVDLIAKLRKQFGRFPHGVIPSNCRDYTPKSAYGKERKRCKEAA
jgi:hypothetical protein